MLFLSYPGHLTKEAEALATSLTARGVPVFCTAVKQTVPKDQSYGTIVTRALNACQVFAVLVDRSRLSPVVENELHTIYGRIHRRENVTVILLLLDGVSIDAIDYRLAGRQAYPIGRIPEALTPACIDALIRDLGLLASQPPAATAEGIHPESSEQRAWGESGTAEIQAHPPGLISLGQDPASQLEELAVVGTGEVPVRDPTTSRYEVTGETALVLVRLPGGGYEMGDDGPMSLLLERPVHRVLVAPYYIAKTVVTRGVWARVMSPNEPPPLDSALPVVGRSWDDIQHFFSAAVARRAGLRFPSEAEWEYACRAGSKTAFCFGDDPEQLTDYAWCLANSGKARLPLTTKWDRKALESWQCRVHPIGQKKPNAFGLFDMHGNVWEMCEDDWSMNYSESKAFHPQAYKEAEADYRTIRGGSFDSAAELARSASRIFVGRSSRVSFVGFRPAASCGANEARSPDDAGIHGHVPVLDSIEPTLNLVRRAQAGDIEALKCLLVHYYGEVWWIVRRRLGPALRKGCESGDIVQDVYVRALRGLAHIRVRDEREVINWLAQVVEHTICDAARHDRAKKRGPGQRESLALDDSSGSRCFDPAASDLLPVEKVERAEEIALLRTKVAQLTESQRKLIFLRDYRELSWKAVADEAGMVSPEAARKAHSAARVRLTALMHAGDDSGQRQAQ